jgi:DNA-directed RNA polymerase sigma subunit (sigma70/sigma32)
MGTRDTVGSLSEAAERRLLDRMAAGDQDARCRLIEAYLGTVSTLARYYAKRWKLPSEDLMQEGADPSKRVEIGEPSGLGLRL